MREAKIKHTIDVLIGLITLIFVSFITEGIVIENGYDWLSKQFYILRCFQNLLFLSIFFYVSYHKIYKKNMAISGDIRLKPYRKAELIIAVIIVTLCVIEAFVSQWKEPGQTGNYMSIWVAGVCYLTIPLFLEQLVLKPQEKKRKRGYIIIVVFGIIGIYMTLGIVYNYLVLFGIVS